MLQIQMFRYLNVPQVEASGRCIQKINKYTLTFLQQLHAILSKHMYTESCKGFCCILLFFTGLNVAIIFS